MLRDKSLIPLSHQHHNALALCVLTERSLAADASAANIAKLATRVIDRYELEMVNHFELEETVLFPRLPADAVRQFIADHRRMTGLVEQLRVDPTAEALREFSSLLRQHVRSEENDLFQRAQESLPRPVLDEIGEVLDRQAVRVCLTFSADSPSESSCGDESTRA